MPNFNHDRARYLGVICNPRRIFVGTLGKTHVRMVATAIRPQYRRGIGGDGLEGPVGTGMLPDIEENPTLTRHRIESTVLESAEAVQEIRLRAHRQRCDELLGCAEMVTVGLSNGRLRLPIEVAFPDPPDVVLSWDQGRLAIEVSRVGWQRQSEVCAEANNWPGSVVEISPELCVDAGARRVTRPPRRERGRAKRAAKGLRTGDFQAIRLPGEPYRSDGWAGDAEHRAVLDAVAVAISRKQHRLSSYLASARSVWLFLINDTGIAGALSALLNRADLRAEIGAICARTGFEAIFVYGDTGLVRLDVPSV